jgi:hypothetical protein
MQLFRKAAEKLSANLYFSLSFECRQQSSLFYTMKILLSISLILTNLLWSVLMA